MYISTIAQNGYSALMLAVVRGWMNIISLLVNAGTTLDLQNKVLELAMNY